MYVNPCHKTNRFLFIAYIIHFNLIPVILINTFHCRNNITSLYYNDSDENKQSKGEEPDKICKCSHSKKEKHEMHCEGNFINIV